MWPMEPLTQRRSGIVAQQHDLRARLELQLEIGGIVPFFEFSDHRRHDSCGPGWSAAPDVPG